MDLSHQFRVPVPVEEAWAHFSDVAGVAECFPGATVTSAEGDTFQGTCKVKLGPIALLYTGSGTFVEKDETAHRFVVEAKGKDKRGNGTAGATVTLTMAAAGGSTDIEVLTDLSVTGKPAQFGRGVMQDVSDKLLGQFVACLEDRLGAPGAAPEVVEETDQDAEPFDTPRSSATQEPPGGTPEPQPPSRPSDDAINLGSTVMPVLIRTYWLQGVITLVLLAALIWLIVR